METTVLNKLPKPKKEKPAALKEFISAGAVTKKYTEKEQRDIIDNHISKTAKNTIYIVNENRENSYTNNPNDEIGETVYKFIGVFETSSNESTQNRHVHNLVSTSYPVGS